MHYAELAAAPDVTPWVSAHWHFRVAPGAGTIEHTIPPTGGAILVVGDGGEVIVAGARVTPLTTTVRGGDSIWGSHLWPGASASLLGVSGDALRERTMPVREVLGDDLADRLAAVGRGTRDDSGGAEALDRVVRLLVPVAAPLDAAIMTAVAHILASDGSASIADVAATVGLSPRQLRRRFRPVVGLTAKELLRIRRLRASALDLVREPGRRWVEIAAEHGYADQPHLVREYRELLGLTPTSFDDHARRIRHGRVDS